MARKLNILILQNCIFDFIEFCFRMTLISSQQVITQDIRRITTTNMTIKTFMKRRTITTTTK